MALNWLVWRVSTVLLVGLAILPFVGVFFGLLGLFTWDTPSVLPFYDEPLVEAYRRSNEEQVMRFFEIGGRMMIYTFVGLPLLLLATATALIGLRVLRDKRPDKHAKWEEHLRNYFGPQHDDLV